MFNTVVFMLFVKKEVRKYLDIKDNIIDHKPQSDIKKGIVLLVFPMRILTIKYTSCVLKATKRRHF